MATKPYAKTEQVLTTLTPADLARLDAHAEKRVVSRAEAVRDFILDGLDTDDHQTALAKSRAAKR